MAVSTMDRRQGQNKRNFGPAGVGCCGDFDFTLAFEFSILTILPACLFILSASFRLFQLYQKPPLDNEAAWLFAVKQVSL